MSVSTLTLFEVQRALRNADEHPALVERHRTKIAKSLLKLFRAEPAVIGNLGAVDAPGAALVVANHRSALDVGILLTLFNSVMVSRADIAQWPVLGALIRRADTILVDRNEHGSGAHAIRKIRRSLKDGKRVGVFPEGTTFADDVVRPFMQGAFAATRGLGVPIIPVGIAYQHKLGYVGQTFGEHLLSVGAQPRNPVCVAVGMPLSTNEPRNTLVHQTHAAVQSLVVDARAHLDDLDGQLRHG